MFITTPMTCTCSMTFQTVDFSVDTAHHDITADDLFLLSNDIPQSHSPDIEEDSDSEELVVGKYGNGKLFQLLKKKSVTNQYKQICIRTRTSSLFTKIHTHLLTLMHLNPCTHMHREIERQTYRHRMLYDHLIFIS